MDPYLGPACGALLAGLGAGAVLGVVRLRRLSLAWWRRRAAALPAPAADADAGEVMPDPAVAPPVFAALGATALAALVVASLSFVGGAARSSLPAEFAVAAAPASLGAFAARLSSLAGFALLTVASTLVLAFAAAALDRLLGRLVSRVTRRVGEARDAGDAGRLTVPDLVAAARALLPGTPPPERGEPFGVGLAYVGLFAAAALGVGALAAAAGLGDRRAIPGFAALAAIGLLATPALYAAAAERSRDPVRARLRRDAAVRQLAAAPAWCIAGSVLVFAGSPLLPVLVPLVAGLVFAVAIAVALPGAGADPGAWKSAPVGGDRAEPAVTVRALTGIAHYAWLAVAALLPLLVRAGGEGGPWPALGLGAGSLVVFLAARAAFQRRSTRQPAPPLGATA